MVNILYCLFVGPTHSLALVSIKSCNNKQAVADQIHSLICFLPSLSLSLSLRLFLCMNENGWVLERRRFLVVAPSVSFRRLRIGGQRKRLLSRCRREEARSQEYELELELGPEPKSRISYWVPFRLWLARLSSQLSGWLSGGFHGNGNHRQRRRGLPCRVNSAPDSETRGTS